jgi:hypothetical protein
MPSNGIRMLSANFRRRSAIGKSGGGPPQSKTLARGTGPCRTRSVLDCASPLALWPSARSGAEFGSRGGKDLTTEAQLRNDPPKNGETSSLTCFLSPRRGRRSERFGKTGSATTSPTAGQRQNAATVSPSPGGEGRGEDGQNTN